MTLQTRRQTHPLCTRCPQLSTHTFVSQIVNEDIQRLSFSDLTLTYLPLSQQANPDESSDHHFRKPANDITSQLEINFGDLGRPGRGRGGARGGRGGRGGGGSRPARGGGRPDKVTMIRATTADSKGLVLHTRGSFFLLIQPEWAVKALTPKKRKL